MGDNVNYTYTKDLSENEMQNVLSKRTLNNISDDMIDDTVYVKYKDDVIGYFSLSHFEDFIVIQEFEILSAFRKNKHGSSVLSELMQAYPNKKFMLYPEDEEAKSFFQSVGFKEEYNEDVGIINLVK